MALSSRITEKFTQNPDHPNISLARTIRLKTDEEMAKSGTICVQTLDGSVFKDVIVTTPIRGFVQLPFTPADDKSEGELVIIGFLSSSFNKPFLISRCPDISKPMASQHPLTSSFISESFAFSDDGKSNISFSTLKEKSTVSISLSTDSSLNKFIPKETTTVLSLTQFIGSLSERINSISSVYNKVSKEVKDSHTEKVKKLESEIEELKLKWKSIEQEGNELKEKIKKVERENDSLKEKVKQYEIQANSFTLDCKSVSLGGKAPVDAPVLFNELNTILISLLTNLSTLTVTCPPLGGPSSPPLNFAAFSSLQAQLIKMKSKYIKIE